VYFRLMLIGFFEGIGSERGIAWRVADSLSLREFLGFGLDERTPDHVTISRTRRLLNEAVHQAVFGWVLREPARHGLLKGKTIGIDATTLEANAAMKSIERRDTAESYTEQAVDLQTGAIVAVTTHGGATGDTESIRETLPVAGEAVAAEIATRSARGQYTVNQNGVEEMVTDKGYHSGAVLSKIAEWSVRSYVSEPQRGRRQWTGQPEEQAAVYANRRRIDGGRGLALPAMYRGAPFSRPRAATPILTCSDRTSQVKR
jgi:transposase